jgi:hypothetical protein
MCIFLQLSLGQDPDHADEMQVDKFKKRMSYIFLLRQHYRYEYIADSSQQNGQLFINKMQSFVDAPAFGFE